MRFAPFIALLFLTVSCQNLSDNTLGLMSGLLSSEMTDSTISAGLKEALEKGTSAATKQLSANGGYSKNALYRIAIPEEMKKLTDTLKKVGFSNQINAFESKMNEAAEEACQSAAPIFLSAITKLTMEDVKGLLGGSKTAVTDYFKKTTTADLRAQYFPIVKKKMEEIGAVSQYNALISKYNSIPFTDSLDLSLENYVTDKALAGLFDLLAETERDIRENPAARTSALLKKVFAGQDAK